MIEDDFNFARFKKNQKLGHYESYFLRANHPEKPYAFWIRYTIFKSSSIYTNPIGELWAVYFNGETKTHTSLKKEIPISECFFSNDSFDVKIGNAILKPNYFNGEILDSNTHISWEINYTGNSKPIFLLPKNLYDKPFPKAKSVVSLPYANFNGQILINDEKILIEDWIGSQNHNWGEKHTDYYAWGQVAGFDNSMETFLEIATASVKFGPLRTPFMTLLVLRDGKEEYSLNSIIQSLKAYGKFKPFYWKFSSENNDIKIDGKFFANKDEIVHLRYYNPSGGIKECFNTKIASCKINVTFKKYKNYSKVFETKSRGAFEILSD